MQETEKLITDEQLLEQLSQTVQQPVIEDLRRRLDEKNTSIKEMEFLNKKLLDLNRKLSDMDSVKTKFLSLIKNEFNNPLSSVLNLCQILIEKKHPDKTEEVTKMMHMEMLRLDFQIKNIIAASEIEAGKSTTYFCKVELENILRDCRASFIYLIEEKNLKINFESEITDAIVSDSQKLYMILLNVLSNACEFSNSNSTVSVKARSEDGNIFIRVEDTGEVIKVQNKKDIFNRFAQYNIGKNRPHTGLGLGLSVVLGMCEGLDGDIDYESRDDGFTFFDIKIPMRKLSASEECETSSSNMFMFESFDDAVEM